MRSSGRCIRGRSGHCNVGRSLYHFVRDLDVACNLADANAEVQGCAARASARRRSGTIPASDWPNQEAEVEESKSKVVHRKFARLVVTLVTCIAATAFAATIKNGVVPKNQIESVKPYLGDYEGQWNSSVTDDVSDGISRYKLENPVMRLSLDAQNQLRVQFYIDPASAQFERRTRSARLRLPFEGRRSARARYRRSRRRARRPSRIRCSPRVSISIGVTVPRACMRCRRTISNSRCWSIRTIGSTWCNCVCSSACRPTARSSWKKKACNAP